jgi:virginiamycin B lyase
MLKLTVKQSPARRRLAAIIAVPGIAVLVAASVLLVRGGAPSARLFVEYPMSDPQDSPMAIAAAADGTIWFTIDQAESIGRVRRGNVERMRTPGRNFEPLGLAVAGDGSAWYTDIERGAVMHISSSGEVSRFPLDSPIVRLGRLAVDPDGSVWFADITGGGITSLKDGTFAQHEIGSGGSGPYGVAVTPEGIVWATLQGGSKLVRISPGGEPVTIDLPRPGAVPTDVAIGADGSVWFLQFRANRVGQFRDGKFSDFEVAKENAGLSGLAIASDGAVWFGMVRSSSLGRLRDGKVETFRLPRDNARPYSLAADPGGNIWYADISGYVGMLPAQYARRP